MTHARPARRATSAAGLLLCAALLAACASVPRPDPATAAAAITGRMALRVAGDAPQALAADFDLRGHADAGSLVLSGALGATLARADWKPGEAVLRTPQGESRHASLEALSTEALGEPLPVQAWFDWLDARPWPGAASTARADGKPGFAQLGWQVDTTEAAAGVLVAERAGPPAVVLRLRRDR